MIWLFPRRIISGSVRGPCWPKSTLPLPTALKAYEVEIEVNAGQGQVDIVIVGLPDAAVKESKDRVKTAVANSGYQWSQKRTTINLAPADIKKEGPSFDLPIALGMIAVTEDVSTAAFERFIYRGERLRFQELLGQ